MTDTIYRPEIGEWVRIPDGRVGKVNQVEHQHSTIPGLIYERPVEVQLEHEPTTRRYRYRDVSPVTFLGFCFRGPRKGGFGLIPMWVFVVAHIAGALLIGSVIFGSFPSPGWRLFTGVFGAVVPLWVWGWTWMNYTRRVV